MQRLLQLKIVNVVATAELRRNLQLERLASEKGFLYDRDIYRCAYLKDDQMRGKVSIFATGKMISVGTKSYRSSIHDLKYTVQRLVGLGLISPIKIRVKLQNMVATADIGAPIDVERLAGKSNVIYEPEQFPGAIYYAPELEGASVLVFANGKVVLAGLKNEYLLLVGRQVISELAATSTIG